MSRSLRRPSEPYTKSSALRLLCIVSLDRDSSSPCGRALLLELRRRNLSTEAEKSVQIYYQGELVSSHRLDIVVEEVVVVEVKAVRKLQPIPHAQMLSYLKASGCRVGLPMNFNVPMLIDGLRRFVR